MSDVRPNVVVVHCHDLGQHLGCYGVPTVATPNLDAFAAQGVRLARSFCTAPSCSPSRAALFTGRYPHSTGVLGLCHANFGWDLHPEEQHLAQLLAQAGYTTAAFGVVHETRSGATRCGYQHVDSRADAVTATDHALAFLGQRPANQPFFMAVGYFEPHRMAPAGSPRGDQDFIGGYLQPDTSLGLTVPGYLRDTPGTRQELAELQGAIRHVDTQFGRLLAGIDLAHTLVIFTTDHGLALPRAKCSLYDPGIAVALLLRWPGWHGTYQELISNVDVVPAVLELLNVPVPANVHGRSFAPLLAGEPYTPRREVFAEMTYHDYYDPRRCIRTATHKLIANFTTAPAFMDPSQSWRPRSDTTVPPNHALAYHEHLELYDLTSDPLEQHDLAREPALAMVRRDLADRLRVHLEATADPILLGAVTGPHHWQALAALQAGPEKVD